VVEWLAPVALFWTMAALYLGGFPLKIEGGSGGRQFIALLVTFALYLAVWFGLRAVLRGPAGVVGGVIIACLIATVLLPLLARVGFRAFGVRIS
jgi:hypothetical protein